MTPFQKMTDFKLYLANGTALGISTLTDAELQLKIALLSITILYTLHKWYIFHNKNAKKNNDK